MSDRAAEIAEKPFLCDLEYTHEIVCPHCGKEQSDSWESATGDIRDGDESTWTCQHCDETFTIAFNIELTYTSREAEKE